VTEILSVAPISEVWRLLGGGLIRHNRARAFWRDGDGWNVTLDDSRGAWFDHRDATGGGLLDLIVTVNSGTRADALKWLADTLGIELADRPNDEATKAERVAFASDLPSAALWRRAALDLADNLLTQMKAGLFDPNVHGPADGEVLAIERLRASIQNATDRGLVNEYRQWLSSWPGMTNAMVQSARRVEQAEARALHRFISAMSFSHQRRAA
jgi:hypothetical protein